MRLLSAPRDQGWLKRITQARARARASAGRNPRLIASAHSGAEALPQVGAGFSQQAHAVVVGVRHVRDFNHWRNAEALACTNVHATPKARAEDLNTLEAQGQFRTVGITDQDCAARTDGEARFRDAGQKFSF